MIPNPKLLQLVWDKGQPNPKLLQLVWDKGQPLRSVNTMGPMDLWDPVGRTDSLGGPALGKMSKTCWSNLAYKR